MVPVIGDWINPPVGNKSTAQELLEALCPGVGLAGSMPAGSVLQVDFDSPNGQGSATSRQGPLTSRQGPSIPALSVVVPVYGCGSCVEHLHERLTAVLSEMDISYELVLVDDRAGDGLWPRIEQLAARDDAVRGLLLSRNFGQHAAITAGLRHARGERVAVMDCDLQDPPEDLPRLYAKSLEGHEIVFGRRVRKPTGWLRGLVGRMYFRGIKVFAGANIDGQYGSFSVISRKVVDAFDLRGSGPPLHDDPDVAQVRHRGSRLRARLALQGS